MFGKGLLKGLGITFKHTFEREITVQYPEQMPFLQNRFRGCLEFDFTKCIACGLCTKACPNNVLKLETAAVEGSKKKKLMRYIIDLQYCMFCNLCVEACPHDCLSFNHNFELSQLKRDDIRIIYDRPAELDQADPPAAADGQERQSSAAADEGAAQAKRIKQLEAMKNALTKNPQKTLGKLIEQEGDIEILSALITADEKKLAKIAELMIDDREKAVKIAQAFVNKEKKDRNKEGGEQA
ncbi:MAG TPA: NADH-quinone oxidoreductase subunit I [Syntrophomonadaceae bacterium]|nr:NADH-quinone oxidoreductase subunit I [Syntrophomonadaceae bacterium]